MKHPLFNALVIGIVAVGMSFPAFAQAGSTSSTPLIGPKNLVSPTYRGPAVQTGARKGLTNREAKRLAATAESRKDHRMLAEFFAAKARGLEVQAEAYEEAASVYRNGPKIKNLMSPTTAGQYEFIAQTMRDEAKFDLALAASPEHIAHIASR